MTLTTESILGASGPVAEQLGPGYEPRPEQIRMGEAVETCLAERGHTLIEAGTGVGKSFAYLIPAMLRCVLHGETVVVATNTITLQEQLLHADIPVLSRAFANLPAEETPHELRPVLVKGRGNYLSLRRLQLASQRQERLFSDAAQRRSLHVIEDWAQETEDGSLSTLPSIERPGIWDRVQSDSANCMGRKCPTYNACFYQSARREMERGNLLICNHALFFSDLALRVREAGFLPRYDHVILDEAHGVEDAASDHFGLSLTEGRVTHLIGALWSERTGRGFLSQLELESGEIAPIERAVGLVRQADFARRKFFEDLAALEGTPLVRNGRMREPGLVDNPMTEAFNSLCVHLKRLKEEARNEVDKFELNAYAQRASDIADSTEALIDQALESSVYWIETRRGDGAASARVRLACSPLEVGPLLKEHLFASGASVVLTSATLATRRVDPDEPTEHAETAFAYTMNKLGCDGARSLQLGSPFDYATQAELYVHADIPVPGRGTGYGQDARNETRAMVERILDHLIATEGGAFILFTSFQSLNRVSDALRLPLADLGMPLLAQGRDGSRSEILHRFRQDPRSVLCGAASFWQGVDVRGDELRNVIITKLPFDPPDRPLTEARGELIRSRGGDPFRQESLPRAVIRFKQGFGRLIRSKADQGRVVVLDPRLVTKGYGKQFLRSLPVGVPIRKEISPNNL